jgi:hypothetical protein
MAEKLRLTVAELTFLLKTLDTEGTSPVPVLFGFADSERTDAMAVAGLGSLLLRGLAAASEERVQLAPDVAAAGANLVHAKQVVQIGLLTKGKSDGAILFATEVSRILVTPLPHRCFEVLGLAPDGEVGKPLEHLVREFLAAQNPGLVSMLFGVADSPEAARQLGSVTVGKDARGQWSMARAGVEGEITGLSEAETLSRFRAVVRELVA